MVWCRQRDWGKRHLAEPPSAIDAMTSSISTCVPFTYPLLKLVWTHSTHMLKGVFDDWWWICYSVQDEEEKKVAQDLKTHLMSKAAEIRTYLVGWRNMLEVLCSRIAAIWFCNLFRFCLSDWSYLPPICNGLIWIVDSFVANSFVPLLITNSMISRIGSSWRMNIGS